MSNWQIRYSRTGRPFFFNKVTGKSCWKLPCALQDKAKIITVFDEQFIFYEKNYELFVHFCDQFKDDENGQINESALKDSVFFRAFGDVAQKYFDKYIENKKEKQDIAAFHELIEKLCYVFDNILILEYESFKAQEIFKETEIPDAFLQIIFQNYLLNIFGCFKDTDISNGILIKDLTKKEFYNKLLTNFLVIRDESIYMIQFDDFLERNLQKNEKIVTIKDTFQKLLENKDDKCHLKTFIDMNMGLLLFVREALTHYSTVV